MPIVNKEKLTWGEWKSCATAFGKPNAPITKKAWQAGEDPTEYQAPQTKGNRTVNEANASKFEKLYILALRKARLKNPDQYMHKTDLEDVYIGGKMIKAFAKGNAHLNPATLKSVCKELGIKYGLNSIKTYLNESENN